MSTRKIIVTTTSVQVQYRPLEEGGPAVPVIIEPRRYNISGYIEGTNEQVTLVVSEEEMMAFQSDTKPVAGKKLVQTTTVDTEEQ